MRVETALAPARAAQQVADATVQELHNEQRGMYERHQGGDMTEAEVRYEVKKLADMIAEAEAAAAKIADELAEAWAFFEKEGTDDCAAIGRVVQVDPMKPLLKPRGPKRLKL